MDWGLLANAAVIGATIGAAAAGVNGWFQRRFEKRKWYADLLMKPRLEALRNLHRHLVESHYAINLARPQTRDEHKQQVQIPVNEFFNALAIADVYLDEETRKVMRAVLGSLRQISSSIRLRLPQEELPQGVVPGSHTTDQSPDWELFTDSFDAAHKRIGEILNPQAILKIMADV